MKQDPYFSATDVRSGSLRMPALFIGHGSPMNAIEANKFSRAWETLGRVLPRPKAILCISAHWETAGTQITAMQQPRTIHDFYGFPPALFQVNYPAPGDPVLATHIQERLPDAAIALNTDWGLDHGCWSVLCRMFPAADIPVLQLSLDRTKDAAAHYAFGHALRPLREQGVLIIGSGNIVHNLAKILWSPDAEHAWASAFDHRVKQLIDKGKHQPLINYQQLPDAKLAIPTAEHFLPLLYILGLQEEDERIEFFNETITLGAISMLSLQVGSAASA